MSERMMGRGVYDAREVERLLAIPAARLSRWASADPVSGVPAIVSPAFERAFSFTDLVALWVLNRLRDEQVSEADIRRGGEVLRKHFKVEQPLSHKQVIDSLATSGNSFLADFCGPWIDIGKNAQGVFEDAVKLYLKRIESGKTTCPTCGSRGRA